MIKEEETRQKIKFTLYGHRGLLKKAPENTRSAYGAAVHAGLGGIELDAVQSKDGEIICSHNFDLERETDGFGYVYNKTWSDLKKLKIATHREGETEQIPTLINVLGRLPNDCIINIEIKTHKLLDISTATKVAKIIQRNNRQKTTLVSSFNPVSLRTVKRIDPEIKTGFLVKNRRMISFSPLARADYLHPRADVFNNQTKDYCGRNRLGTNIWTVNTGPGIAFFRKRDVDGIITDYPEVS
jgi:glycerophosphoryl diester phosphodiesterase